MLGVCNVYCFSPFLSFVPGIDLGAQFEKQRQLTTTESIKMSSASRKLA